MRISVSYNDRNHSTFPILRDCGMSGKVISGVLRILVPIHSAQIEAIDKTILDGATLKDGGEYSAWALHAKHVARKSTEPKTASTSTLTGKGCDHAQARSGLRIWGHDPRGGFILFGDQEGNDGDNEEPPQCKEPE